ncbi:MAG TPA: hypothetical protein VIO64_11380 [Pseudobacteroides sp.]|uniref:hypothetical protein n=1 Tax=Pseudobacteroides sp. TaxID=1968840 RepID=UPI002F939822
MDKESTPKTQLTDEELMEMVGGFDTAASENITSPVTIEKYGIPPMMKYGIKPPITKYGIIPPTLKYGIIPIMKYGIKPY